VNSCERAVNVRYVRIVCGPRTAPYATAPGETALTSAFNGADDGNRTRVFSLGSQFAAS